MSDAAARRTQIDVLIPAVMLVVDIGRLVTHFDERDYGFNKLRLGTVREAMAHGVNMVQLRAPAVDDAGVIGIVADTLKRFEFNCMIFCNTGDDMGSAHTAAKRGVAAHFREHSPGGLQRTVGTSDMRERFPSLVMSRSVHSVEAARRAEADGADLLVLGTVFPSASHPDGPTIGIDGVRDVCAAVGTPVIAIGGITSENARDVIAAGAAGVAVISAVFDAPHPSRAAEELRATIDGAWRQRQ